MILHFISKFWLDVVCLGSDIKDIGNLDGVGGQNSLKFVNEQKWKHGEVGVK